MILPSGRFAVNPAVMDQPQPGEQVMPQSTWRAKLLDIHVVSASMDNALLPPGSTAILSRATSMKKLLFVHKYVTAWHYTKYCSHEVTY